MLIKKDETYGFGAAACVSSSAQKRRNTHMLSFFAAALSTAVLAVMVAVVPISEAITGTLPDHVFHVTHNLGVAAATAFSLSTAVCALMLLAPTIASRKFRRRKHN
jgi:hypothetical protein